MTSDIWEVTSGGHRRLSRRPETLALLDRLVQQDARLAADVTDLRRDEQRWGGTGLHYAGVWRATGQAALLKLGVAGEELAWLRALATNAPNLAPALFASGEQLGPSPGLDLRWTVSERLPFGLGPAWRGEEFTMLLDAGVRFQQVARRMPPGPTRVVDAATVRRSLERGMALPPPGPAALVLGRFEDDWAFVARVCAPEICHGDLHMANALCRTPPPGPGRAVLIDPAPAIQPWAFDAAWAQVLNSIDRRRVGYTGLVPRMAARRAACGLPTCDGPSLPRLALVTLGWFALVAWGLSPDRHTILDYRTETQRYLEESADI